MSGASHLSDSAEARFWQGVRTAGRFFMGEADVQKALEKLVQLLDAHGIPYAIVGAMALNEFGYQRTTSDVDVLLTPAGLAAFKAQALGRGQELIRIQRLPKAFALEINAYVRDKYLELWQAVQDYPDEGV